MGKARKNKLLRRAARNMTVGQANISYDLNTKTNRMGQPPTILRQGCTKAMYKQLKKDNPDIVFEDSDGKKESGKEKDT